MTKSVKAIPEGYHSVTPYLAVDDAARALEFYQRVFGAKEIMRMNNSQGRVGHAEIKIGDSIVMLAEETPNGGLRSPHSLKGSTVSIFVTSKMSIRSSTRLLPQEPSKSSVWLTCFGVIATAGSPIHWAIPGRSLPTSRTSHRRRWEDGRKKRRRRRSGHRPLVKKVIGRTQRFLECTIPAALGFRNQISKSENALNFSVD